MKVCIIGASGKLGRYMIQHALERGYEVVGVCREKSVSKLDEYRDRMTILPGATNDPDVIREAVAKEPGARLVFSCGWHITRDGKDVYSKTFLRLIKIVGWLARVARLVDIDDQVEACRRIFASDTRWTVVRGSDLEEGASQGLPVWSRHVQDPILESNLTRRIDFALFMVDALTNDELIQEAPAIVGRQTPSALEHTRGQTRAA